MVSLLHAAWICGVDVLLIPDVDVSILARGTSRFSGADLQNLIKYLCPYGSRLFFIDSLQSSRYPSFQREGSNCDTEAF